MTGRHRKIGRTSMRLASVGVATATAAAMTVATVIPTPDAKRGVVTSEVKLAAGVRVFPDPNQIPDLSFGLGTAGYDLAQAVGDAVLRAILENVNLGALAHAAGVDPESLLKNLPGDLLTGALNAVPIDIAPFLGDALKQLLGDVVGGASTGTLIQVLALLGITDGNGLTTVTKLLGLLGLDLSDSLDLSDLLHNQGLNLITAGPPFSLLKLLGVDLGWVPGFPNSVAAEVNNTKYLPVGLNGLLTTVLTQLKGQVGVLDPLVLALQAVVDLIPPSTDVIDVRVPVVAGFGLGAFAAGMAYPKLLAQLGFQPGSPNSPTAAEDPLLGSLTILPMILLRNPGRENGGLFARLYPLARLFGVDTVTPDTEVSHSGGTPLLNTGLALGGANLVPVKVDATVEYDLLSDVAAWPNPVSLANNLMGFVLPTHLLRGIDTSQLTPQLQAQIQAAVQRATDLNQPLALNLYLTLATNTLPLLEPLYLLGDLTSLATFGLTPNPFTMLANALAPALTSLTNLGYTDAVRQPDGSYTRTLDDAGTPTAFFSFPNVNWAQVPGDIVNQLIQGFQKEFFSGNPTPGTPNAITGLLKLLTGTLGLGDILNGLNLNQLVTQQMSPPAATTLVSADAKTVTLSVDPKGDVPTGKHAAAADAPVPQESGEQPKHAAETTDTDALTATEVKPDKATEKQADTSEALKDTETQAEPQKDKGPLTNVVRDTANATSPQTTTTPANGEPTKTSDSKVTDTKTTTTPDTKSATTTSTISSGSSDASSSSGAAA